MITRRRRFHRNDTFVALVPLDMQNKRYKPGDVLLKMPRNVTIRMFTQRKIGSQGDPFNDKYFRNYAKKLKKSPTESDKNHAKTINKVLDDKKAKKELDKLGENIAKSTPKQTIQSTPPMVSSEIQKAAAQQVQKPKNHQNQGKKNKNKQGGK